MKFNRTKLILKKEAAESNVEGKKEILAKKDYSLGWIPVFSHNFSHNLFLQS